MLRKACTECCQAFGIFFELRKLILAIHIDNLFEQVSSIPQPACFLVTLRQQVARAARAEFIAEPFGNRLAGLATSDRVVVAFLNQESAPDHAPGVCHAAMIAQTPHQRQRSLIMLNGFFELTGFTRHQAQIGEQHSFGRLIMRLGHEVERLQIVSSCTVPFAGVSPQISQIRQRRPDSLLVAENLLQLQDFLIMGLS